MWGGRGGRVNVCVCVCVCVCVGEHTLRGDEPVWCNSISQSEPNAIKEPSTIPLISLLYWPGCEQGQLGSTTLVSNLLPIHTNLGGGEGRGEEGRGGRERQSTLVDA